jgi:DnaK suppressor protein
MPKPRVKDADSGGEIYRESLLRKRDELLTSLGLKSIYFATNGRVSDEDQAQVSHDEFIALCINSLGYQQLRLVKEALDRLDSGDFGDCQACGEKISPRRLQVLPWARYCVICQAQAVQENDSPSGLLPHERHMGVVL